MGLDLNLLISLDALLQERSVSRAAVRLGLSQPTLSTALARLRRHYGDELLSRIGNSYTLTPLAERLLESTGQALAWTDRVFDTRPDFEPGDADHEFAIVVSDAQLPIFGRELADLVQAEAPGVRLRFVHSTARMVVQAHEELRTVDALVLPQGILSDVPSLDLYRDHWVCVVSADGSRRLDPADLAARPWVLPYHPRMPALSALHRLQASGVEPRAEISTEDFLAIPHLVRGTDRIGLMPERVARLASSQSAVAVAEIPFELGMLVEALWWHPMHERDPAHRWLRQVAVRAAERVDRAA
ncbi:LysR family transcriptional regulator [Petropleomorpha daqingensis]|uniref:DNA-binding transcriptional LysR family regulator n=1 Tax=Petropleomorpha daqingensis TaxID=2026353 RepID=A0A853CQJ9_9ACTN|nr:DNA-binding transcriptional LysR family regulator [Petropleomorpha daqingensis]